MDSTGGENIYPMKMEKVVNEYPAVLESPAIGIFHPVWSEVWITETMCKG